MRQRSKQTPAESSNPARLSKSAGLLFILLLSFFIGSSAFSEPATVRYIEGVQHGLLTLRDMQGKKIADGEMLQQVEKSYIKGRLVLRFRDGSYYLDDANFTQR